MTNVAEEKGGRSKFELLAERLERLRVERAALDARFQELPELEEQARVEALRRAPTQNTWKVGSPVEKLSRERREAISKMEGLDREIRAAGVVLAELHIEELRERFASLAEEASKLAGDEFKLWREAGKAFVELIEVRRRLVELWEAREGALFDRCAELGGLLAVDEQAREEINRLFKHPILPIPVTVAAFLDLLLEGIVDPRRLGYQDGPAGTRLDHERQLPALLPDLRGDESVRPAGLRESEKRA